MDNIKKCNRCGRILPIERFYKRKLCNGNIGQITPCKDCRKKKGAEWYQNNKEKVKAREAKRYQKDKAKIKARSIQWRKDNPDRRRIQKAKEMKRRRAKDPGFRIICSIKAVMNSALKGNIRAGHTIELLGCSIEDLRKYIERQFQPGMTWDNYGIHGWHIDHIIPLSYFDHGDLEQQKRAWHYTNLQPLWAKDNRNKSDKIEEIQLILL